MYCPKCGSEIRDGLSFCPKCGESLGDKTVRVNRGVEYPIYEEPVDEYFSPEEPNNRGVFSIIIRIMIGILIILVIVLAAVLIRKTVLNTDKSSEESGPVSTESETNGESGAFTESVKENKAMEQEAKESANISAESVQKDNSHESGNETDKKDSRSAETDLKDEYIFHDSDSRYLTENEVSSLTKDEIQTAINELYARKGRGFKDKSIQAYFDSKSWYRKDSSLDASSLSDEEMAALDARIEKDMFNKFEKTNKNLLAKERDKR